MADPVYVGEASGGGGRYYDPDTGMYWTEATGWYYSSGGDESSGAIPGYVTPGGTPPGGVYQIGGVWYDASGKPVTGATTPTTTTSTTTPRTTSSGGGGGGGSSSGGSVTTIETDPVSGRRYRAVNGIFSSWMDPVSAGNYGGSGTYPGDANGDGIQDATGLANGVVKVSTSLSPTGYIYGTTPVYPNGAPYTGGATSTGGNKPILIDKTGAITGRAGTSYYYDDNGLPHTLVTGSTSSSSGSSSGGSSLSGSGGGGGGSSSSGVHSGGYNNTDTTIHEGGFTNTNISDLGPNSMANNAADRAQQAAQFAATNSLAAQRARVEAANAYANALMTYDPAAYEAFKTHAGGDLQNAIGTGGNAISQNALLPAAMALEALNGLPAASGGGGLQSGTTAGGGDPTSPGATGGGDTQSGGSGNTTTQAPAAGSLEARFGPPPGGYTTWADFLTATKNVPVGVLPSEMGAFVQQYKMQNDPGWQQSMTAYAESNNPWGVPGGFQGFFGSRQMGSDARNAWYQHDLNPSAPIAYQPGQYIAGGQYAPMTPTGATVTTGGGTAAAPSYNTISTPPNTVAPQANTSFSQPYPNLGTNPDGSAVSPVQLKTAPHFDYATNQWVPTMATGGLTRAPMAIVGDPQRDGRPNPEVIHNPTGAPISVTPMRNMRAGGLQHMMPNGQMMAGPPMPNAMAMQNANPNARFMRPQMMPHQRMGGLVPRFAYGTDGQWYPDATPIAAPVPAAPTIYPDAAPMAALAQQSDVQPTPTTFAGSGEGTPTTNTTQPLLQAAPIGQSPSVPATTTTYGGETTGGVTTPAGTGNPLMDQALADRLKAQLPLWAQNNPYAFMLSNYDQYGPTERNLYEQYLQTAKGIPIADTQFAAAKNRMGGLSRGSLSLGY